MGSLQGAAGLCPNVMKLTAAPQVVCQINLPPAHNNHIRGPFEIALPRGLWLPPRKPIKINTISHNIPRMNIQLIRKLLKYLH
jgi:hypothetical protein